MEEEGIFYNRGRHLFIHSLNKPILSAHLSGFHIYVRIHGILNLKICFSLYWWCLVVCEAEWRVPSKDIPILGICDCYFVLFKTIKGFADVIKLRILRWGGRFSLPQKQREKEWDRFSFFFLNYFNWRIVTLQYCVDFFHTSESSYVPSLRNLPPSPSHPSRLSRSTGFEPIPTGYLLHTVICIFQYGSLSLSHPLPPLCSQVCSLCLRQIFLLSLQKEPGSANTWILEF